MSPTHLSEVAHRLEKFKEEPFEFVFSVPPRHGKSELVLHWIAWALLRHPELRIAYVTYNDTQAKTQARRARRIALSAGLQFSNRADGAWLLNGGGVVDWEGVNGSLTGRGYDIIIIDDPVKNRVEAESTTMRERAWAFYQSDCVTRLEPGSSFVCIQCMAGDTPVLMANGTEKPLRDVRLGDAIATYEGGRLATSVVKNWANQGPDDVFRIRMSSGKDVLANARHPFLVEREGVQEWKRLAEIRKGDRLVRAGVLGAESAVPSRGAASPLAARASADRITTETDGLAASGRHRTIGNPSASGTFATGTESSLENFEPCSSDREVAAPCAENCHKAGVQSTGRGSSALTTVTKPDASADYSATTATLSSDAAGAQTCSCAPLSTYAVTLDDVLGVEPAGREDVFDIQVERTENFIANGLVSHNTRWHEDDLAGRLTKANPEEDWEGLDYISMPAITNEDGDDERALWPSRWPLEALKKRRQRVGPYAWASLFQGQPRPRGSTVFGAPTFFNELPSAYRVGHGIDLAYTEKTSSDFSVVVTMFASKVAVSTALDPREHVEEWFYVRHVRRRQVRAPDFRQELRQEHAEFGGEMRMYASGTERGALDFMTADVLHNGKLVERGLDIEVMPPNGDKFTRAIDFAAAWNAGRVLTPSPELVRKDPVEYDWVNDYLDVIRSFSGVKDAVDDDVDASVAAYDLLAEPPVRYPGRANTSTRRL